MCMLGAKKQKAWLSDQKFAEKFGFQTADETADGYRLLALSFDGTRPHFLPNAKRQAIDDRRFTVYYDDQCPFIPQRIEKLRAYCEQNGIDANFIHVETPEQAKELALRVQQLGGVREREVRHSQSAGRCGGAEASWKVK